MASAPPPRLQRDQILSALGQLPGWELDGDFLRREWRFSDFSEAFGFMARVALLAESHEHHPDWSNVYSSVKIALQTHDAGGVTQRDLDLATAIQSLS